MTITICHEIQFLRGSFFPQGIQDKVLPLSLRRQEIPLRSAVGEVLGLHWLHYAEFTA